MSNFSKLFQNNLAFASVLHSACLKLFTNEYVNWEPEVIRDELTELYKDIPEINFDKIQAICTLISTELFYDYFESFENICMALNSEIPMFDILTPLDSNDMFWALIEAKLTDEDEFNKTSPFSKEVQEYIIQILKKDGITRVPPFIKNELSLGKVNNYDLSSELDKVQLQEQINYETDLNSMIKNRVILLRNQAQELLL